MTGQLTMPFEATPEEIVYAHDCGALRGTGLPTEERPVLVLANGSGSIQPLDNLFAVLERETLDPAFRRFGGFIEPDDRRKEVLCVFGNFLTLSHVFRVNCLRGSATARRLEGAIKRATSTPAYAEACINDDQHEADRRQREQDRARGRFL